MGTQNFYVYIFTALIFIISPGMDTVFVLNKAIAQGKRSGIHAAIGINAGILVHTLLGALGLSLLIAQSEFALGLLKYCGGFYLVYTGVLKLKNAGTSLSLNRHPEKKAVGNDFWSGFLTNTLNPKVALFFLTFFPRFIAPDQIDKPLPFILLGITYTLMGIIWYLFLSLFASSFSKKILARKNAGASLEILSGFIFILMGLYIAWPSP